MIVLCLLSGLYQAEQQYRICGSTKQSRNLGAPEFPVTGSLARWGLASPRRPPSPAPLPAPSCCHPLHLRLPSSAPAKTPWYPAPSGVVVIFPFAVATLRVPYVPLRIGFASAAPRTRLRLACDERGGRRCTRRGGVPPWPGLTLRSRESPWHEGLKPPSLPHKNRKVPLCARPHPHSLIDLRPASSLPRQLFRCSPLWPCPSSAAVPSTARRIGSAEPTSGGLRRAVAVHHGSLQDPECVSWGGGRRFGQWI